MVVACDTITLQLKEEGRPVAPCDVPYQHSGSCSELRHEIHRFSSPKNAIISNKSHLFISRSSGK